MNVSSRHRHMIQLLLDRHEEMTAAEVAAAINVSTRTVHRELSELSDVLKSYGAELHRRSGKGLRLEATPEQLEKLRTLLEEPAEAELTVESRYVLLLCQLLEEREPVKLFSLAHELSVTVATISYDLDELEKSRIEKGGLQLIRRRGYGVQLEGPETSKRQLIVQLAEEQLDVSDLFGPMEQSDSCELNPVKVKLLSMIGREHFLHVEEALWNCEDSRLQQLSDLDYTKLLIRLSTAVARVQRGYLIEEAAAAPLPAALAVEPSAPLQAIIRCLSDRLSCSFPPAELTYMYRLLQLSDSQSQYELLGFDETKLLDIVHRLIQKVEERLALSIEQDRSLREGLLHHMGPALKRIREGVPVRNPLLREIKRDYKLLFEMIREAVDEEELKLGMAVPDEEIGYLAMHFGAALERLNSQGGGMRIVVVCTSGIGFSKMLAMRLAKEFPQVNITGHASVFEAVRLPKADYDLIVSTVDLPLDQQRYMKLSPLLPEAEVERLRSRIRSIPIRSRVDTAEGRSERSAIEELLRLQRYVDEMVRLLQRFTVRHINRGFTGLEDALLELCSYVQADGGLNQKEQVVRLLMERERVSSQAIPDTSIALFHTRSDAVPAPYVTLFRLRDNLPLEHEQDPGVRQVLLMLGPRELSKESLEILSEISAQLLLPELLQLLEEGTEKEIVEFFADKLLHLVDHIIETERMRR
ncbi:BglG family transcription antiterminator [Paenibacillus sp. YYML68]|uniref:BglG family transcription antiterminator n=1 Tax=Paenibacillus sp. YYML68 TaxID=2909250 RepID=UPI00248F7EEB|nr:BglG family transcription antiterminator [Paenibacillus sp. YYML68]